MVAIEPNERMKIESKEISETVQESSLHIDPVHRLDEGVSTFMLSLSNRVSTFCHRLAERTLFPILFL